MRRRPISVSSDEERLLRRQIRAWLWTLSFPAYCALVRLLLARCGYSTVRAPQKGTDGGGGFDLLAFSHSDLTAFMTAVSLKTGRVVVSRRLADEMRGSLLRAGADQGLLIATGAFSRRAREVAGALALPALRLIDGEEMAALLFERRIGIKPGTKEDCWEFDPRFFEELERRAERSGQ